MRLDRPENRLRRGRAPDLGGISFAGVDKRRRNEMATFPKPLCALRALLGERDLARFPQAPLDGRRTASFEQRPDSGASPASTMASGKPSGDLNVNGGEAA